MRYSKEESSNQIKLLNNMFRVTRCLTLPMELCCTSLQPFHAKLNK